MQKPSTMNFSMPRLVHQAEDGRRCGIPGTLDLERAAGLSAIGVAQVGCDAAVLALELPPGG